MNMVDSSITFLLYHPEFSAVLSTVSSVELCENYASLIVRVKVLVRGSLRSRKPTRVERYRW